MRLPRWRLLLPAMLLLLGLAALGGCIYIPWTHKPADPSQVDLSAAIGDRDSGKPIRLGQVSKQAVVGILGPPLRESADGRVIAYVMQRQGGTWVMPLCFYAKPGEFDLAVRLEFDDGGTLRKYQFMERENYGSEPVIIGRYPHMHEDINAFLDAVQKIPSDSRREPPRSDSPDASRYETVPPP